MAGRLEFEIRFGWLVLMALAAQLVVIYLDFDGAAVLRRLIFPLSYVLLLAFVALNRRRIGFLVIGAGMLLNFLAIVTNGGLMPISPEHLQESELAEVERGDAVPDSKNVLLEESDIHLRWLSDRFRWGSPGPLSVFSIGDVIVGAGLIVVLVELLLPALQRSPPDRTPPT